MPINIAVPMVGDMSLHQLLEEMLRRSVDGSIGIPDGTGLILLSPNGTKYRLGVDNDGALTTTLVP